VSRTKRIEILSVAAVTCGALMLGGCGKSDDNDSDHHATDHHQTVSFVITDGHKTSGPDTIDAKAGEMVMLEVTSNAADELHVHGYDKELELEPGVAAHLDFTADIPGTFEVELHSNDAAIASLQVKG
jgi:uncharacterized cupredoxin-like copper-binding protein